MVKYVMSKEKLTKKQKMIARIQEFTLMDDDFMTRFFENDKDCTQYVLQTILENKKLKVIDTVAQKVVKSLEGRSVRLDVYIKASLTTLKSRELIKEPVQNGHAIIQL